MPHTKPEDCPATESRHIVDNSEKQVRWNSKFIEKSDKYYKKNPDGGSQSQKTTSKLFLINLSSSVFSFCILNYLVVAAMVYLLYRKVYSFFEPKYLVNIDNGETTKISRSEKRELDKNIKLVQKLDKPHKKLTPRLAYYAQINGLQLETVKVTTDDGFILELQHLIDPKESEMQIKSTRKPIFLLHGLLQSSAVYITSDTGNCESSIGYYLHSQGFDVWLGNNRCGFNAEHTTYKTNDPRMWNWNFYEMAKYDVSCFLDYIIAYRGNDNEKISVAGHSQGTAQLLFCILNNLKDFNSKVNCYFALAPAIYPGKLLTENNGGNFFFKLNHYLSPNSYDYCFGLTSFLPIMLTFRNILIKTKLGCKIFGLASNAIFLYLFDWKDSLWNKKLNNRNFLFAPTYISSKLIKWWLIDEDGFLKNYKSDEHIFPLNKSWFDDVEPEKINDIPNIYLVIPKNDNLVDPMKLLLHFQQHEQKFANVYQKFHYKILHGYSHIDVLWSHDAVKEVGYPMVNYLKNVIYKENTEVPQSKNATE